jgi:RNA-binding protein
MVMNMKLNAQQIRFLKAAAHELEPVVRVGKAGVSDALVSEIRRELDAHELIKVRFIAGKDEKKEWSAQIVDLTACAMVTLVGNVLVLYRENPDPQKRVIKLPR